MINYKFITKISKLSFVEEIWLFGSRARSNYEDRSDIDLAILCPTATAIDWQLILDLTEKSDTLLKIDCVRFDALPITNKLRDNILKFRKILYNKKDNFMDKSLWQDYFENLGNALNRLKEVLSLENINQLDYLQDATIKRFEFVIELYWKVLKKFLSYEKIESNSPRDVLRKSFQFNLIDNENIWLQMLDDRNNTSHVYNQEDAKKILSYTRR